MSVAKKIIIGILTFSPIFIIPLYLFSLFTFIQDAQSISSSGQVAGFEDSMELMAPMFIYIAIIVILSLGMLIFYIVDIVQNPKFNGPGYNKLIWILIVVITGLIGMIVYFFVEIVPRKELPPLPKNKEII